MSGTQPAVTPRERNAAMHRITVRLVSLAALASSALLAAGLKGW
jgi:hypothetical protein